MTKKQTALFVINIIFLVALLVFAFLFCVSFVDFLIEFNTPTDPDQPNLVGLYILVFISFGAYSLPVFILSLIFSLINRKYGKKRGNILLTLTLALFALMLAIFIIVVILLS